VLGLLPSTVAPTVGEREGSSCEPVLVLLRMLLHLRPLSLLRHLLSHPRRRQAYKSYP